MSAVTILAVLAGNVWSGSRWHLEWYSVLLALSMPICVAIVAERQMRKQA